MNNKPLKLLLALSGILLTIYSINLFQRLKTESTLALLRDDQKDSYGIISDETPPICSWKVEPFDRVLAENKSQAILISLHNTADKNCETVLTLRAPGFDISPSKEEQTINLPVNQNGSISWIVVPRKAGGYELSVSDYTHSEILGINVTNMFGLGAVQAKVFSIIGSLFGPMFTVPWWWDRWTQIRLRRAKEKEVS